MLLQAQSCVITTSHTLTISIFRSALSAGFLMRLGKHSRRELYFIQPLTLSVAPLITHQSLYKIHILYIIFHYLSFYIIFLQTIFFWVKTHSFPHWVHACLYWQWTMDNWVIVTGSWWLTTWSQNPGSQRWILHVVVWEVAETKSKKLNECVSIPLTAESKASQYFDSLFFHRILCSFYLFIH